MLSAVRTDIPSDSVTDEAGQEACEVSDEGVTEDDGAVGGRIDNDSDTDSGYSGNNDDDAGGHIVSSASSVEPNVETEAEVVAETYEATAYTAFCEGCSGITYSGIDVRNTIYHEGRRIIAVDPSVIPLGTIVKVTLSSGESFEASAQDIGSAIQGRKIDVLVGSYEEAITFGRQAVEVEIK